MEHKLQNIIFPASDDLETKSHLYYRGAHGLLDRENKKIEFADRMWIDFATYFNGCSYSKWKKYTDIGGAKLVLRIKGEAVIVLVGYTLNVDSPVRKEFGRFHVQFAEETVFEAEYPDSDAIMIAFEINAIQGVTVYGGEYFGKYEKEANDVTLSICMTTCRKEEYVTKNAENIRRNILEDDQEQDLKEHLYFHIVDNGKTLDAEKMNSWHIQVHPNKNTGGSGGFTRGMIEAMRQTPRATHVLLMDDDVIVLPESIKRTYRLFRLVNEKYKDAIVGGAMMFMEDMDLQHEDVGTVRRVGYLSSLKGNIRQDTLKTNLTNEMPSYASPYTYAAWWYCGIPVSQIDKNGLPMPYFIRFDDVEYGRRLNAKIMTMNGVCIWHMGFFNKYNAAMDNYQNLRNAMISQAVGTLSNDIRVFDYAFRIFHQEIHKLHYHGAQMVLEALQDYLKGPEFIEQDRGLELLEKHSKQNEKFVSMSEFRGIEWELPVMRNQGPIRRLDRIWYRLTDNGHRFCSEKKLKEAAMQIVFDATYVPSRIIKRKKLYAVNPQTKMVSIRRMDREKYRKLMADWRVAMKEYKENNDQIRKAYREKKAYLTSLEFWKKYLEID